MVGAGAGVEELPDLEAVSGKGRRMLRAGAVGGHIGGMPMKKGDTVFYVARAGAGLVVRGVVDVAHKDGTARVRSQFFYEDGRDRGPYLGDSFEFVASELYPNAMSAEQARAAKKAAA